jgi:hypothetical protein
LKGGAWAGRSPERQSIQFVDQDGNRGIAEQSKEIDPSNRTWTDANTSYLNNDQVGELVEYLQKWLEEGRFVQASSEARAKSA